MIKMNPLHIFYRILIETIDYVEKSMNNIAIVCGSFHKNEVEKMLNWANEQAVKENLSISEVIWVPGAMEVPLALDRALSKDNARSDTRRWPVARGRR